MNKALKTTLLLASLSAAATTWAAGTALTHNASATATSTITDTTHLDDTVTIKLSKGVRGAYDLSQGGGTVGVATGHIAGRGKTYRQGTSTTATNLGEHDDAVATIADAMLITMAQNAAS